MTKEENHKSKIHSRVVIKKINKKHQLSLGPAQMFRGNLLHALCQEWPPAPVPTELCISVCLTLCCSSLTGKHAGLPHSSTGTHLVRVCHCLFQELYLALKGIYLTSFSCNLFLHPHLPLSQLKKKKKGTKLYLSF